MGKRTQALIGTMDGVATVRVYSANPKTPDGYNTFVFRREIEKSLRKLTWSPIIELSDSLLPEGGLRTDGEFVYTKQEKDAARTFVANSRRIPRHRPYMDTCISGNPPLNGYMITDSA